MGKLVTFLASFAFSFSATAGNANLTGDQVKVKLQEAIDRMTSEGMEMDAATQFMNAAQIACGEENSGSPTVNSNGPFLKFAARHPIVSTSALELMTNIDSHSSPFLNEEGTKTLESNTVKALNGILNAYANSSLLCSELAGRQMLLQTLDGLVSAYLNETAADFKRFSYAENSARINNIEALEKSCPEKYLYSQDSATVLANLNILSMEKYKEKFVLNEDSIATSEEVFQYLDLNEGKTISTCEDIKVVNQKLKNMTVQLNHRVRADIKYFGFGDI